MKIAVIGSGISGLSAAHYLSKKHQVDLFEKDDHFGGHSYTVEVSKGTSKELISIDIGFIVFNKINYPNLVNLFETLKVPYQKSNMSFSVSVKNSKKTLMAFCWTLVVAETKLQKPLGSSGNQ